MNHGGVKMAAPEPTRLDNKRERRRGAAGRAAALRRAPSDSDCSGETASLSADSGDRAPRPPVIPPRSGKSRSRRRGSEWEVLEGLKDGQRFEKRPDVFNGYLHKKRKWPLKGWHKRFFVVDGGILVYARSPTDVARGRLHGSVDVGLSVISAKARRRRIDIDADEFIYHLRAKTADVFRTWLNVLKTHRLYRQHLLTFGARESVPKIHAPLEDLPPTDTSRTSHVSSVKPPMTINHGDGHRKLQLSEGLHENDSTNRINTVHNLVNNIEMLNAKALDDLQINNNLIQKPRSSSSKKKNSNKSRTTNAVKQIHSTILGVNSNRNTERFDIEDTMNETITKSKKKHDITPFNTRTVPKAYYLFTPRDQRKANSFIENNNCLMKRSKKSTNLVKYRNSIKEPVLRLPISRCMLLGKYKQHVSKQLDTNGNLSVVYDSVFKKNNNIQTDRLNSLNTDRKHRASMTALEIDNITEKLCSSFKDTIKIENDVKSLINQVIKELYEVRLTQDIQPIKTLFKRLLEHWLQNTTLSHTNNVTRVTKSVNTPSNVFFTKDENLSSEFITKTCQEIQVGSLNNATVNVNEKNNTQTVSRTTSIDQQFSQTAEPGAESYEKDLKTQQLEKLLKNTIYICETARKTSKDKDIKTTLKLINNLGKSDLKNTEIKQDSSSSTERMQETINNLISETAIPPDLAKQFLGAYLDVLLHDDSKSVSSTSSVTDNSVTSKVNIPCEVQTEAVVKRISKSVTTLETTIDINNPTTKTGYKVIDPGQLYLKCILDKITTIFSRGKKSDEAKVARIEHTSDKPKTTVNNPRRINNLDKPRDQKEYSAQKLMYENSDEKSVVTDISKYDLEHISMCRDPKKEDAITLKPKDIPPDIEEYNPTHIHLKLCQSKPVVVSEDNKNNWMNLTRPTITNSNTIFRRDIENPFIGIPKELDLKPYLSSRDGTPKTYPISQESDHSVNLSFKSSKCFHTNTKQPFENEDPQSCYIMAFKYDTTKKKDRVKDDSSINPTSEIPPIIHQPELSLFEKPAPRIVDEKFLLLLLENLMILSKNIPSLYKDISNFYMKLRKKHEKVVKNCDTIQGLSLLGKIYNENSCCSTNNDATTQWDLIIDENNLIGYESVGINTDYDKHLIDENTSGLNLKTLATAAIQTDKVKEERKTMSYEHITDCTQTENVTRAATPNTDWYSKNYAKDRALTTFLKYILNPITEKVIPKSKVDVIKKSHPLLQSSSQIRNDLAKEISFLSPLYKASFQSQTDRELITSGNKRVEDFQVYPILMGNEWESTRTNSLSEIHGVSQLSDELKTLYRCSSDPSYCSGLLSPTAPLRGPQAGFVSGTPGGRLAGWIIESGGPLENASRELGQAQLSVQQLQRLLDALELQQQIHHDTDVSVEGASPNVKKDRRKFGLRKKKSHSKCASVDLQPPNLDPSSSHMALSALTAPPSPGGGAGSMPSSAASLPMACAAARPQSLPGAETLSAAQGPASLTSLTPDHQLREDFTVLAKDLVASLKSIVATLVCERGRLRVAMEAADSGATSGAVVAALRTNLSTALHQNSELRTRLSRIHDASDLLEISSVANLDTANRQFQQSLSYSSSCVSASEFFDAEEHDLDFKQAEIIEADEAGVIELDGDSSSEAGSLSSEEGSASSDNSDTAMSCEVTLRAGAGSGAGGAGGAGADGGRGGWSRRTRLPCPRPTPGGPSLWNLLYKNIGKDLSQISMPVTINEPLNMLQRLCEELEYSELLDSASECKSPTERMALVASFAVSAYASSAHRAASKPFNPLLAETYECVRDDKGFRFLAEQVSHHPPISACHAESSRWCFWQEARIKTKFWGKSMEFQPTGRVHVRLLTTGDHYSWNKVTTCVHNLFGGQRWVDQYGDMHITCHGTDISCKLNFIKASSWSSSRHEVRGAVSGPGGARLRLAGRWSEALLAGEPPAARCLWRPGAMPPEHDLYYGFTRFAMELNEIEPNMRDALPHTDTRLRPDQRALEEGSVEVAEQLKHQLEQAQRERRRDSALHMAAWFRKAVEGGEETWVFSGEYWKAREAGFPSHRGPAIW